MFYFDTHCHLLKEYFTEKEITTIIKNANERGVSHILIPGTNKIDSFEIYNTDYKFANIFKAVGVHPSNCITLDSWKFLLDMNLKKVHAIGEIGLDKYHETNPPINIQIHNLEKQLELCLKYDLPALIHNRDTCKELYSLLSKPKYKNLKFVLHSFAYGEKWAKKFLDIGGYISFSGMVTFKNARDIQAAAKIVPLDKMLIETDTPYLAPVPHRGKSNEPQYVIDVVKYIANIKQISLEEISKQIFKNSIKLFNI